MSKKASIQNLKADIAKKDEQIGTLRVVLRKVKKFKEEKSRKKEVLILQDLIKNELS